MAFNTMERVLSFFCIMLLSSFGQAFAAVEQPPAVARVNGVEITEKELLEATESLIPNLTYHGTISEDAIRTFREKALDTLITQELIYQNALARGVKADREQASERFEKIRSQFRSTKDYQQSLAKYGISEKQLKARIERDVIIVMAFNANVTEPARTTEDILKDYYAKNLEKFRQPESIRLRVISIKDEQKARTVLSRITAGEDFGTVAAKMSEDNYRIKGGDIGWIHRGRLQKELEESAFGMKAGERSGLIRSQDKWYILRVEEIKAARQLTFDESRENLKKDLERKRAGELGEKWIGALKDKARIEIFNKPPTDN